MPKHVMHIPVKSGIKDLKLDQKVTFQISGTIRGLESRDKFEAPDGETESFPPEVRLEVSSVKISTDNKFADMGEETD